MLGVAMRSGARRRHAIRCSASPCDRLLGVAGWVCLPFQCRFSARSYSACFPRRLRQGVGFMVLLWLIIIVLVVALIASAINPELGQRVFVWRRLPLDSARWWSITALVVLVAGMFLYRDAVTYDPMRTLAEERRQKNAAERAERDQQIEKLIKSGDARDLGVAPGSDEHTGQIVGYSGGSDTRSVRVIYKVSMCARLERNVFDEKEKQIRVRIVEGLRCGKGLPDTSVPRISALALDAPVGGRRITTWDGAEIPRCEDDPERAKACDVLTLERASRIKRGEVRELGLKPKSDRLSGRIIGYRHYVDRYGNVDDDNVTIFFTVSPCARRGDQAFEENSREVTVSLFEESERGPGGRLGAGCANRGEYQAFPQRKALHLDKPLGDRRLVLSGGDKIPACDADPRRKRQCGAPNQGETS
ncbi:hypothetical protein ACFPOI_06675 [Nonomuraea angiospora]|uniref:Uncharacterized protein n=1 Tax=Nonomuraea angiospora TaxID=46172 RepID=A0ABR9MCQ5_9ACTN|nr:hypothetical protein [Nonomuraea angiospora]MBE1590702.1 hypothetical protein [Nonomuraea angiospora]